MLLKDWKHIHSICNPKTTEIKYLLPSDREAMGDMPDGFEPFTYEDLDDWAQSIWKARRWTRGVNRAFFNEWWMTLFAENTMKPNTILDDIPWLS